MSDATRAMQPWVDSFLGSQHTMRLATSSADGTPHVVPVWYMYRGGALFVGTHTRTIKARNVAATGRAAFCIDTGVHSPDIFGVAGHGCARLVTSGVKKTASEILAKYYDTVDDPAAQELLADTDCIILITPEHMTSWRY